MVPDVIYLIKRGVGHRSRLYNTRVQLTCERIGLAPSRETNLGEILNLMRFDRMGLVERVHT